MNHFRRIQATWWRVNRDFLPTNVSKIGDKVNRLKLFLIKN